MRMRLSRMVASAALAAALLTGLTGCGSSPGGGSGAAPGNGVKVSLKEFSITPNQIHIPVAGGTIVVKNDGTMPHNFTSAALGIESNMLGPGDSQTITVKPGKAGSFQSYCGVAGHKESGMAAEIIAE